jgi:hypothetical protein
MERGRVRAEGEPGAVVDQYVEASAAAAGVRRDQVAA